ncbi:efflux RND transporter periplasmic adaptor subunit [Paraburkholderia sp. LEh10]|uniref:efflux RND transporter periplasmic adaptor subunit n=1 Tax=Paraburkholderia sp. LEh10 TaxID=2821353 RepID=UPI001AE498C1|nr:efflux RND transporter periplasmic adaptor subunit [Paraburkholderia sp. LEh10]MBP0590883.1 efflux RND transporter periplasmic adaptor subunit [Paraburkholderia sp. LEh10]
MDTKTRLDEDAITRRGQRTKAKGRARTLAVVAAIAVAGGGAWLRHTHVGNDGVANARPAPPREVTVSRPLVRELDTRLGFLGQYSAVDQVELRAQVGGTLTGIHFRDGDIVHKGDLLFTIDPVPYEIRLEQAKARQQTASARLLLAKQELARAQELERNDAGTTQNVQQRASELHAAQAALDDADAQIRDARFDLDHCRIAAPFTGRIGRHLVSAGNLVAGSRAATSPTTLLATLVSLDPIYLDFDMSEADYESFQRYRGDAKGPLANRVELASGDATDYTRQGTLDFVDNVLDRSSGTIHARATVPNADLRLTPGEFSRVRLAVAHPAPMLLVPDAAVLPDQSEHIVMTVAADGTVAPKHVETGDMRGGLRVIRSGLSRDDRVIVDGLPYAAPGMKVATRDGAIRYDAQPN